MVRHHLRTVVKTPTIYLLIRNPWFVIHGPSYTKVLEYGVQRYDVQNRKECLPFLRLNRVKFRDYTFC